MQFRIRALDRQQQVLSLRLEALDENDALAQMAALTMTPISMHRCGGAWRKRSPFSLSLFAQELHALVLAGLSVIESLEVLIEKESKSETRAVLSRLVEHLRGGHRLSTALSAQPQVFPALFIGIVQAAEGTSDLPRSLGRYIDYRSRLDAVRDKMVSATLYPAVLVVVGAAVGLFLLAYVVPRFSAVYQGSGRSLPWASQLLVSWGAFASQHALVLALAFAALATAGAFWLRAQLRSGGIARAGVAAGPANAPAAVRIVALVPDDGHVARGRHRCDASARPLRCGGVTSEPCGLAAGPRCGRTGPCILRLT